MKKIAPILLGGLLCFLAACSSTSPTPTLSPTLTPSATPRLRIVTPSGIRPTLPPTFTPTFTPTDLPPPSATFTITPSPTFTPIPLTDLCADFQVIFDDPDGLLYRAGEQITLMYILNLEASVQFVATSEKHRIDATLPGATLYVLTLDPSKFPASGRYEWSLSLTQAGRSGLCEHTGAWQIDNTPAPESTAESTAEATVESTAESTMEATAEVTSEATAESTAETD